MPIIKLFQREGQNATVQVKHGAWLPCIIAGCVLLVVGGLMFAAGVSSQGSSGDDPSMAIGTLGLGVVLLLGAFFLPTPDLMAQLRSMHEEWLDRCMETVDERLALVGPHFDLLSKRIFQVQREDSVSSTKSIVTDTSIVCLNDTSLLILQINGVTTKTTPGCESTAAVLVSGDDRFHLNTFAYHHINTVSMGHDENRTDTQPRIVVASFGVRCDGQDYSIAHTDVAAIRDCAREISERIRRRQSGVLAPVSNAPAA